MLMSDIATRVREIINDPDGDRWKDEELFRWTSDAEMFVVNYRPDATAQTQTLTLVAGTRQVLPAGCVKLMDPIRAVDANGNPKNVIVYIDRNILDTQDLNWHSRPQSLLIKHVIYDNRAPREFMVYPPAKAGAKVDMLVSVLPTDITALTDTLSCTDNYRDIITNLVTFRCYCKDTEARSDKAQSFLAAASQGLGIKLQKDVGFQPDLNNKGANPASVAVQMGGV